jgi:hypothetical protein
MENEMSDRESRSFAWLACAGIGIAVALCASRLRTKAARIKSLEARERARLVPLHQARNEADWTRKAVSYAGGAKGG